jgi:hypothetical protein
MDICLLLMSLEAIEWACAHEDPVHNPPRKLPTWARKETRDLVPSLWPESPRNLAPRSIATSARSAKLLSSHGAQDITKVMGY